MQEAKLTWWQALLVTATLSTAAVTVWSALRAREAAERVLASLKGPPAEKVSGPPISTIIPTFNEVDYLPNLLVSLQNQTYEPLEVIVADWNSTDGTREVAASFGALVVDVPERGVGPARNAGAQAATGDFFLFLDADTILESALVEDLMLELLANDALLAHPRIGHYEDGAARVIGWLWGMVMPQWYTTRCVLIRREAFEALDGYRNMWREDTDIGKRLMESFGPDSIVYLNNVVSATSTRRTRAQLEGRVKAVKAIEFPAVRDSIYYE